MSVIYNSLLYAKVLQIMYTAKSTLHNPIFGKKAKPIF